MQCAHNRTPENGMHPGKTFSFWKRFAEYACQLWSFLHQCLSSPEMTRKWHDFDMRIHKCLNFKCNEIWWHSDQPKLWRHPPKMYFVNIGFFKHVWPQDLCIGITNTWTAETPGPGSLVAISGPGVQSHSHCKVWKVANDIHVGGVHRSLNGQACGMCGVLAWVQWDFPGGFFRVNVNLWDVTVCL